MKKILHMTPPDINNGVHKYIFNHLPYLDMEKLEFAFLSKSAQEIAKTEEYRKYGFRLYTLHNTERDNKEGLKREIDTILNDGYDAIHLHTSSWRGFFIEETAMEMGVRQVIVHSHSTGIDEVDDKERAERIRIHNGYKAAFSMQYATDLCACSKLAGDWLFGEQIPRESIQILPNAIDVRKYHFLPQKREFMRKQLQLNDRIVVGNVGRYCYQKNQEFLIRAFAKAYRKNRKLFLLCMGHGAEKDGLMKTVADLGVGNEVRLLDWQSNVEDYLQAMDLFCLPSRFEGLGIAAIEAQAAGLKCLLADEVPREAGVTTLAQFLPLKEEIWSENLACTEAEYPRRWWDDEIAAMGYDIKPAAKKLEMLYL